MDVHVRACTPADAGALALVAQATFVETFGGVLAPADVAAHCVRKLGVPAHQAWLAEPEARLWLALLGGFPVGYAGLAKPDLPSIETFATDTELRRIYVLKGQHGDGTGAALMQEALAEAQAMGKRRVVLGVYLQNARAIAFYGKQGFTPIGTRKFQVGGGFYDDLVLARDLA
jgi:diamine N-acetyltransferase